jgi:hypothetical protein
VSIIKKENNKADSGLSILPPAALLILAGLVSSSSLFAGLTPCAGTYNLGNSGAGALVSPGGASAGCEQVDKEFNNFSYSAGGSNPEAGGSVGTTFAGSTPTGAIGITFGSSSPVWSVTSAGATSTGVVTYTNTVDPAYGPGGGAFYAITSLELFATASFTLPAGTSDNVTLFEYFCAGGSAACTTGTLTDGINLAAPTAGYIEFIDQGTGSGSTSSEVICFNNGATSCTPTSGFLINFATSNYSAGFTNILVSSGISVSSVSGTQVSLNNFTENFFETLDTPEPATFGLMGAALAGLSLLGLRKRR